MGLLQIILIVFHDLVSTHAALAGQNLALRKQLAVLRQSVKRLKLRRRDRLFCVVLSSFLERAGGFRVQEQLWPCKVMLSVNGERSEINRARYS